MISIKNFCPSKLVKHISLILLVLSSMTSLNLSAEMFIHELKYQQAAQIIPVIKPHLEPNSVISSKDNKLFIQSTQAEYNKILSMLKMLDKKPGEFFVEVKILNRKLDDWEVKGARIVASGRQVEGKITRYQSSDSRDNEKRFSLRLTEGYQGFVNTGESFVTNQLVNHYGSFIPQTSNKKVSSGFYVTVHNANDTQVRVAVSAQAQNRKTKNSQTIDHSAATSFINGTKGHWLLLATTNEAQAQTNSRRYKTQSSSSDKRWYYLRVNDLQR